MVGAEIPVFDIKPTLCVLSHNKKDKGGLAMLMSVFSEEVDCFRTDAYIPKGERFLPFDQRTGPSWLEAEFNKTAEDWQVISCRREFDPVKGLRGTVYKEGLAASLKLEEAVAHIDHFIDEMQQNDDVETLGLHPYGCPLLDDVRCQLLPGK